MAKLLNRSPSALAETLDASFDVEPPILHGSAVREGCGCSLCGGSPVESDTSGNGLETYTGDKPVWSTEQVVNNFLRSNSAWLPGSTIAYSFRESKPPGADSGVQFEPLTGIERDLTRLGFELISDLVNLNFVEAPDDGNSTSSSSRIYFGKDSNLPDYEWGHAQRWTVPTGGRRQIVSAEVWISSDAAAQRVWFAGGYNFQALMHEALHTLGIPHPGNYNANGDPITYQANAEYAQDSRQFTIMSYFAAANTGADHLAEFDDPVRTYSGATPLVHDVAALQALYGANTNTRAGDTVYGYNSTAGRAPLDFNLNKTPIFTIWDGGGTDRLDFSQTPYAVNLDLTPGSFSNAFQMTNNISIAFGTIIEDAIGGSGNDRIRGNEAGNRLQGAAGNDTLDGLGGADRLEGGDGADTLNGGDGDDSLGGGAGRDTLDGGAGRDNLFGDADNDTLLGGGDDDRLHGQDGDDSLQGGDGSDYVDGDFGRDHLFGDAGNDWLIGGSDDDRLHGQAGDDTLNGGAGGDYLDGDSGRDIVFGDAGSDWLNGGGDDDRLHGGDGDDLIGGGDGGDFLDGGSGRDSLYGDAGGDHLIGGSDDDRLYGQDGDDLMGGQDGDDFVDGGAGRDVLYGDAGNDWIVGGGDGDRLHGQDGDDLIGGHDGDDFVDGGAGRDSLFGDGGADHMVGGSDNDRLHGQEGDDLIGGQDGDDYIEGGAGRDRLFGDAGADVLLGGDGADELVGNAGADRFVFTAVSQSGDGARDRIFDFDAGGGDLIDLAGIDADVFAEDDQAFTFADAFSGRAGQAVLSYDSGSNTTTLSLDVNGDGLADFRLDLSGFIGQGSGFVL